MLVVRPSKGGAFGHVARLAEAMSARGHEVAIAGPHGHRRDELAAEVIDLPIGRAIEPTVDARALRALGAAYRAWQPDVIHAHGSKGGVLARLARAARPATPLVFTPHNFAFTNYFASATERGVYRVVERALAPLATLTLCVCEEERRVAGSVGPLRRTRVVHNGVGEFAAGEPPAALSRSGDGPLVAAVTEFQEPKGVPTLIAAIPAILEAHPTARFAIAGDGPMRAEIEALVARYGVDPATDLLGMTDRVPGLLASADLLISPSWSESFPYAVLEAMSAALPVVATDVGGVREAVADGESGLLVPARDTRALAGAVNSMLADPERARAFGAAGAARVAERFSFERMIAGTAGVYEEVGLR